MCLWHELKDNGYEVTYVDECLPNMSRALNFGRQTTSREYGICHMTISYDLPCLLCLKHIFFEHLLNLYLYTVCEGSRFRIIRMVVCVSVCVQTTDEKKNLVYTE